MAISSVYQSMLCNYLKGPVLAQYHTHHVMLLTRLLDACLFHFACSNGYQRMHSKTMGHNSDNLMLKTDFITLFTVLFYSL